MGIKLKVLPGMEIALDPNISGSARSRSGVNRLAGNFLCSDRTAVSASAPLGGIRRFSMSYLVDFWFFWPILSDVRNFSQTTFVRSADRVRSLFPGQLGQFFKAFADVRLGKWRIYLAGKAYIHCLATDSHDTKEMG